MKNFLCAIALMLVASVGYSKTNEEKPVQKAKIVVKTQRAEVPKLLPVTYTIRCRGRVFTVICDGCTIGDIISIGQELCGG